MKWLLATVLVLGLSALSVAAPPDNLVTANLLADTTAIAPGKPFRVGLHLKIAAGWHVYWINPGDAGAATRLTLRVPDGYSAGAVDYPVPEKLDLPGGLTVYAYENELLLTARITPPEDLKGSASVAISAEANWCVCDPEECVLGKKSLDLELPVLGSGKDANSELFAAWNQRMPVTSSEAFSSVQAVGGPYPGAIFSWRNQPPIGRLAWIPGPCDDLAITQNSARTSGKQSDLHLKVDPIAGIPPVDSTVSGILAYFQEGQPPRGVAVTLDRRTMNLPVPK